MQYKFLLTLSSFAALNLAGGFLVADSSSAPALSSANAPAVAWSAGALRINGADHTGSGNILPGGKLETLRSSGQLYLADGTRMRLAADTKLTVELQNVTLDSGVARVDSIPVPNRPLHISAGELRVTAGGGTLTRSRPDQLIVTAAATPTEVRRGATLVAMVRPGQTLSFTVLGNQAQSGANAAEPTAEKPAAAEPDEAEKKRCKDVKTEKEARRRKCAAWLAGGAGAGAAGAAGAAAAGGAVAAAGVSTAVVAGVVVATVAAVATSVALVASEDAKAVSSGAPIL